MSALLIGGFVGDTQRGSSKQVERSYFVDEAGDATLFDRKGRIIVGTPGVSHTFMLGICELAEPALAAARLEELRSRLLADPYLSAVPSMSSSAKKTALAFHAKDDVPEVRREVFTLIKTFDLRMIVLVRRKQSVAQLWQGTFASTGRRFTADVLYDDLVSRGFRDLLHRAERNDVTFAARGKSDRNRALKAALERGGSMFNAKWGTNHQPELVVRQSTPSESPGIQVADYLLWSLQRLYERRESRYFDFLRDHFSLICDVDDTSQRRYGTYYDRRRPLTLECVKPVTPG